MVQGYKAEKREDGYLISEVAELSGCRTQARNGKIYISIDISTVMELKKNYIARSPTLETVLMVERAIEKFSGEFDRTELWKKLPKKVMWQTYLVILDYLQSINKIAIDQKDKIGYIWSPKTAKKFAKKKPIKLCN